MLQAMPILAEANLPPNSPTNSPLVQGYLFDQLGIEITPLTTLVYDFVLVAAVFIAAVSLIAMFCIWWERKVAGHMQSRIGPNRVGPIGILQSLADGIKLILKEDLVRAQADH